jgi:chromosome segregation ATPase
VKKTNSTAPAVDITIEPATSELHALRAEVEQAQAAYQEVRERIARLKAEPNGDERTAALAEAQVEARATFLALEEAKATLFEAERPMLQQAVEEAEERLEARREQAAILQQQLDAATKVPDADAMDALQTECDKLPRRLLADELVLKRAELALARAEMPYWTKGRRERRAEWEQLERDIAELKKKMLAIQQAEGRAQSQQGSLREKIRKLEDEAAAIERLLTTGAQSRPVRRRQHMPGVNVTSFYG